MTLTGRQLREGWAFVDPPEPERWPREKITCGAFHPIADVDRRRAAHAAPARYEGCGRSMVWIYADRCADCGRWFDQECLRRHFSASADPPY